MKQVLIKQGQAVVEQVPAPQVQPGALLVRTDHSCLSVGTEMSSIGASGRPLWRRALKEPENVVKAVKMAATEGIARTYSVVTGQLSAGSPTGYSAAGVVMEVGAGVDDVRKGDRVACAGAQCAHHAEFLCVPRNLAVPIPEGLDFPQASTVTLGAIALQGVRRVAPTLGETIVVLGLGVIGQLTAQILKANGCRVIGLDLDPSRVATAVDLGMDVGLRPDDGDDIERVMQLTDGHGADGVIVTAASSSDAIVSSAFRMCRRKGRVVVVGQVGLNLDRADNYGKELDFFISTSYGPGRYDSRYEEQGLDYPIGYVRWTENRNLGEYLRLLASGKVRVAPLIEATHPVERAPEAYEQLRDGERKPLMVLLSYARDQAAPVRKVANPLAKASGGRQVRIAVVGAGQFAKTMHLPNITALPALFHLRAVASRTGHNAKATATQFGADYSTTDWSELLTDPDVDALLICTRHNLHAAMALEALKAGKHVLLEKPLALTDNETSSIRTFFEERGAEQGGPILVTGFNRRFSPFCRRLRELVEARTDPMIMSYRMNAGRIPLDNWLQTEEGGGRNLGEACHVYDLFGFLTGSAPVDIHAAAVKPATGHYGPRDNFIATVTFADGSVGSLAYTALGAEECGKERLEVFVDGKALVLDNYRRLLVYGAGRDGLERRLPDKGHRRELELFARAVLEGGEWPVPLSEQVQATQIALAVERQLTAGSS